MGAMKINFSLEAILNASTNGVIVTDVDGKILFTNKQVSILTDVSPDKLVDLTIHDAFPAIGIIVSKCIQNKKAFNLKKLHENNKNVMLNVTPVFENGIMRGSLCSFQELLKYESVAYKLNSYKQLNEQLEAIFSSSSDGIVLVDNQGIILKMNEASEKINNVKTKDYIGKHVTHFMKTGTVDRVASLEVLETGRQVSVLQYNERQKKHMLLTGTPKFDEKGNISFVVVNERDITELNTMKKELEQSRLATEKYKDELAELNQKELMRHEIIATSKEMQDILSFALKLSRLEISNILILGESGTGKGLISKFIHQNSECREKPFLHINCAAIPENLLEAELFGYKKGAFTGASDKGKIGLFELAEGGTLFLDEIGDVPFEIQPKLLKCLEDHTIRRLGDTKSIKVNCRIIAATNRNLEKLVKEKKFRSDLFYRINAFAIRIPPLRERPDDILELVNYFTLEFNKKYGQNKQISPEMFRVLQSCPFKGNVRELKNIVKKAILIGEKEVMDDLCMKGSDYVIENWSGPGNENKRVLSLSEEVGAVEREILKIATRRCKTTRAMARYLKVSQPTVIRKMRKHGIDYLQK